MVIFGWRVKWTSNPRFDSRKMGRLGPGEAKSESGSERVNSESKLFFFVRIVGLFSRRKTIGFWLFLTDRVFCVRIWKLWVVFLFNPKICWTFGNREPKDNVGSNFMNCFFIDGHTCDNPNVFCVIFRFWSNFVHILGKSTNFIKLWGYLKIEN